MKKIIIAAALLLTASAHAASPELISYSKSLADGWNTVANKLDDPSWGENRGNLSIAAADLRCAAKMLEALTPDSNPGADMVALTLAWNESREIFLRLRTLQRTGDEYGIILSKADRKKLEPLNEFMLKLNAFAMKIKREEALK